MGRRVEVHCQDNSIATLKMNDTEGKNIFTRAFIEDLLYGPDELENVHKPKVAILQGLQDVFCGGADKQTLLDLCDGKVDMGDVLVSERLLRIPFPLIAAIEGHAVGGGLLVGLCCDIIVAARESRYGAVFMTMGFTPGMGCTTLLAELVGPYIANEMMFTGKRFRGSELEDKNTQINYIVPRREVLPKANDLALQISEMNIQSLYLLKHSLSARKKKILIEARLQEDLMHRISFSSPETRRTIEERYVD